jgi:hypothetical protein
VGLVELRVDPQKDPSGAGLRAAMEAIDRVDFWIAVRAILLDILALGGILFWVAVAWPGSVPSSGKMWMLLGYAAVWVAQACAYIMERRWRGVRDRHLAEHEVRRAV